MTPRHYLRMEHGKEWREVTEVEWIKAERENGFRSRNGERHIATSTFVGQITHIRGVTLYEGEDINRYEL